MNRLFRLLLVWLRARRRSTDRSPLEITRTPLRVMPNDLDLLRHVNNGVYLSLLDLGRVDMTLRSGAQPGLNEHGLVAVLVGASIRYRRSLQLWDRFEICTRVIGWDERIFYLEQTFERTGRDGATETVADAWVAARFLARSGRAVPTAEPAAIYRGPEQSPEVPAEIVAWAHSLGLAHRDDA